MTYRPGDTHNYRWEWLRNPWLRRPFLVAMAVVTLPLYVIEHAIRGVAEWFTDFTSTW